MKLDRDIYFHFRNCNEVFAFSNGWKKRCYLMLKYNLMPNCLTNWCFQSYRSNMEGIDAFQSVEENLLSSATGDEKRQM